MPKQKSSASAGTRKKHAKKAAGKDGETDNAPKQQPKKLQRGQKKLSKAQQRALPKVKQYIPPPKPPAPLIPDPLDGQGLAKMLPAELVVILRRLGKKDDITRRKGLDDLREWVLNVLKEDDEVEREIQESNLGTAIPVWVSYTCNPCLPRCTTWRVCFNRPFTDQQRCNCTPICCQYRLLKPSSRTPCLSAFFLVHKEGIFWVLGLLPHWKKVDGMEVLV